MKNDFDFGRLGDVPDPVAGLSERPLPPLRMMGLAPAPTRSGITAIRVVALAAAVLYEALWYAVMNKRDDLRTMNRRLLVIEIAMPLVAALIALVAAAAPGKRGLGKPKLQLVTLAFLAPAVFIAATLFVSASSVIVPDPQPFWSHVLRCFTWTSLYSAGPMVLAAWSFRRSFVASPALRTAVLAMACAAIGAATMSFVCSESSVAHVLVAHGGTMVVAALVGAALGRRFGEV